MYKNHVKAPGIFFAQGSALIAVIAAIAIFSVLATALLSLTSTSTRQSARSHLADKAYFLAESGYRYMTSQYLHPPADYPDPNDALEHLSHRATLDGADGRFDLALFSYFYEITAPAEKDDTMLVARTPGSFPGDEITSLAGQKVIIHGYTYTLSGGSGLMAGSDDQLSLVITPGLYEAVDAKTLVLPLTEAGSGSPWNNTNRTIAFTPGQATMFPARNGRIRVAGRTLAYRLKDDANNVFTDIQDIYGNDLSGFNIPSGATLRLRPYIRVDATGIIGGDDALIRRKVSYFVTLPFEFSEEYTETFSDPDSILTTPRGTHDIDTVGNANPVLKVTRRDVEGPEGLFLSQLDIGASHETANQAREGFNDFRSASGGYLSYDAQTKVGFFDSSGFRPNFIERNDLAVGLSFRIKSEGTNTNMYGLSFFHQESRTDIPTGIIPDGIPPDEPAIILWQQTVSSDDDVTRAWLAYKKLKTFFYDDFAVGINSDTWTNVGDRWGWLDSESDQALFIEAFGNYQGRISFAVSLPECECSEYVLQFNSTTYDLAQSRQVRFYGESDPIPDNRNIPSVDGEMQPISIPLPTDLGREIKIEFYFDNQYEYGAWKVDDVRIVDQSSMPAHNSTLMVRLREGAAIPVNYTGELTIDTGDQVVGAASGSGGRVISPPIISTPGSQGYVLLDSLTRPFFSAGESLDVLGKADNIEVADTLVEATHEKVNAIKVYYASEGGCSTTPVPNPSTSMDCYTKSYGRGDDQALKWPVQDGAEWTAEGDYFRLIQWDGINESAVLDANGDSTIILSHHEKLQSSDISATIPELGLHAMGEDAANHVYFDDFGFQLYYLPDTLFPTPLQQ